MVKMKFKMEKCLVKNLGYLRRLYYMKKHLTLFLCALTEAYLTVPRNPAAALGVLTSPAALVYWRASPKSNMYTFLLLPVRRPMAKLD